MYIDRHVCFGHDHIDIESQIVRGLGGVGILIKEELFVIATIDAQRRQNRWPKVTLSLAQHYPNAYKSTWC